MSYMTLVRMQVRVSMPSRAYTSFLHPKFSPMGWGGQLRVNALSGLYLISTPLVQVCTGRAPWCVNALSGLYLISTRKASESTVEISPVRVNALSGLYLISTVPFQKPRFYAVSRACFCRYLSEYSDNSYFSCMLTFWTYLMRCTYPRHWIKYSTNYNRCHPIFFTLLISWAEQ